MVKKTFMMFSLIAILTNLQISSESSVTPLVGATMFVSAIAATKGMQHYCHQLEIEERKKRLDSINETIMHDAAKKIEKMSRRHQAQQKTKQNVIYQPTDTQTYQRPPAILQPNSHSIPTIHIPEVRIANDQDRSNSISSSVQIKKFEDSFTARSQSHIFGQTPGQDDTTIAYQEEIARLIKQLEISNDKLNFVSDQWSYEKAQAEEIGRSYMELAATSNAALRKIKKKAEMIRPAVQHYIPSPQIHTTGNSIEEFAINNDSQSKNSDLCEQKKNFLLFYLHGTQIHNNNANLAKEYAEDLKLMTQKLALQKNAVGIYKAFDWNGKLSKDERNLAGKNFAVTVKNEIDQLLQENPTLKTTPSIITVSHSHGGNVVYHAGQACKNHNIPIDTAIMFGCPAPDFKRDNYNIKTVLNIMGAEDCTGRMGSALQSGDLLPALLTGNSSNLTTTLRKNHKQAVNITLKIDGEDLGHKETVANGIELIPHIIEYINATYPNAKDLILNASNRGSNSQPDWQITGCINKEFHDAHLKLNKNYKEMEALSNANAAWYQKQYGKNIYDKPSLAQAFTKECGPHLLPALATIGTCMANRIENIINPKQQKIDKILADIKNQANLEQKELQFAEFKTNYFKAIDNKDNQEMLIAYEQDPRIHAIEAEINAWNAEKLQNNCKNSNNSRTSSPESNEYKTPPSSPINAKVNETKDLGSSWSSEDFNSINKNF